jgi:hypothetical protein
MGLFERRIKGKNMAYTIRISSPVPYPEKEIRWVTYGAPLSSFFHPYFEKTTVVYYHDKENKLAQIKVACYDSIFSYKKSREDEFFTNLYRMFSHHVESFFGSMGIDAEIANVGVPPPFEEFVVDTVESKLDKDGFMEETGKPTIVTSPEKHRDELIYPLGKVKDDFDFDEYLQNMKPETLTIQRSEDGRYFVGGISKKDGKSSYLEVPEECAKSIMSE